jgi:hypothetical protein
MAAAMRASSGSIVAGGTRQMGMPAGGAARRATARPARVVVVRAVDGARGGAGGGRGAGCWAPRPRCRVRGSARMRGTCAGRSGAAASPATAAASPWQRGARSPPPRARAAPRRRPPPLTSPPSPSVSGLSEDAELEARLAKLKAAKGATTDAEKRAKRQQAAAGGAKGGAPGENACASPRRVASPAPALGRRCGPATRIAKPSPLPPLALARLPAPVPPRSPPPPSVPTAPDPIIKGPKKPEYDFSNETVFWEGGPANGDLAFNTVMGATLVWLPLTFGAIGRRLFLKYRFTDKRISISDTFPGSGARSG